MKALILFFLFTFNLAQAARHEKVQYKELEFKGFKIGLRTENLEDGAVSAEIEVRKGTQIVSRRYFAKILANGGLAGVYMSRRQRLDDVFLIHKFGDYDSRTILINDKGQLFDLPGGDIFYDEKAKLIFFLRNYETEPYAEYAAYNLKKNSMLFHLKDSAKYHAFNDQLHYKVMKDGDHYFAITTNKDRGGAVEFDIEHKKVKRSTYAEVSKKKLRDLKNL